MNIRKTLLCLFAVAICITSGAQSRGFKLAQWTEIHNAILKELNRSYTDSLPVARIERAAIDAMLESLDPYTVYIPQEENDDLQMMVNKSYGGIGAVIYKPDVQGNVIINEPYEGSPASKYGLVCGDEIMAIDGVSVHGLTSAECSERMRGEPGTEVLFHVRKLRSGDTLDVRVVRQRIHLPDLEYVGMLDSKVGYISQSGFTDGVSGEIRNAVTSLKKQGMKTLVLDLRGNGGGLLQEAVKIVSLFVPKGSVVVTQKGMNDSYVWKTTTEPIDVKMPIIVMVDGYTASASEIVTGALKDLGRATIVGTRTFGKGLVQSIRPLPYGGQLKLTTARYYTPSGKCVQAIDYFNRDERGNATNIEDGGIMPDVEYAEPEYSRITVSLMNNQIVEQYALKYVREHETIPAVRDFHFDDFDDFVQFALTKDFDYRSGAKALFDQVKRELERDGLKDIMTEQIDAMQKAMEMDKEQYIRLKKDEIVPFIEEYIVKRYYFQKAGVQVRLRYDKQVKEVLRSAAI